jgi:hypothetical protein
VDSKKKIEIPPGPVGSPNEERTEWTEPLVAVGGDDDGPKTGLYVVGKDEHGQPLYAPLGYGPRRRWLA